MVEPDSRSGDDDVALEFTITGGLHWAENGDKTNNMSNDRHTHTPSPTQCYVGYYMRVPIDPLPTPPTPPPFQQKSGV